MTRFTHVCSGGGRFSEGSLSKSDARMHAPMGWETDDASARCPICHDDAPVRGSYLVIPVRSAA